MHFKVWTTLCCFSLLGCVSACNDEDFPANGDAGRVDAVADAWAGNQPACSGVVYACSDRQDNDGDGLTDAQDPECVGPCDNDEGSFATGIAGDNVDACKQDCFFDGNSGQGDDKCEWNLKCDSQNPGANLAKACPYDPSFRNCPTAQSTDCIDNCRQLTPNGCDCFGCCEVFNAGESRLVYLGSGPDCTAATLQACAPCTQSKDCVNACDECELCLGKTIDDLPPSCFAAGDGGVVDGGTGDGGPRLPSCGEGITPCLSNDQCDLGRYCLTGCCFLSLE